MAKSVKVHSTYFHLALSLSQTKYFNMINNKHLQFQRALLLPRYSYTSDDMVFYKFVKFSVSTEQKILYSLRVWISRKERLDRRKVYFESKFKRCLTNCEKTNSRQVFVVLYERFENVLICIIYIGSVGPFRPILNFPFFLPK